MKKKIIYGMCMLGLVALVATSCKKKEETASSFGIEMVELEEDDSRFYYDPGIPAYVFEAGDQVKVYNEENNRTAMFIVQSTGSSPKMHSDNSAYIGVSDDMYAFIPYDMASAEFDTETECQTFTLDSYFDAKKTPQTNRWTISDGMFPRAAYYIRSRNVFSFKSIFGLARIIVLAGDNPNPEAPVQHVSIKSITLTDNVSNLAGTVTLCPYALDPSGQPLKDMITEFKENGTAFTAQPAYQNYVIDQLKYSANGTSKSIELNFENEGNAEIDNTVTALFGLRPGTLANGGSVEIVLDNNQTITFPIEANRATVTEPNKIKNFVFTILDGDIDWSLYEE